MGLCLWGRYQESYPLSPYNRYKLGDGDKGYPNISAATVRISSLVSLLGEADSAGVRYLHLGWSQSHWGGCSAPDRERWSSGRKRWGTLKCTFFWNRKTKRKAGLKQCLIKGQAFGRHIAWNKWKREWLKTRQHGTQTAEEIHTQLYAFIWSYILFIV